MVTGAVGAVVGIEAGRTLGNSRCRVRSPLRGKRSSRAAARACREARLLRPVQPRERAGASGDDGLPSGFAASAHLQRDFRALHLLLAHGRSPRPPAGGRGEREGESRRRESGASVWHVGGSRGRPLEHQGGWGGATGRGCAALRFGGGQTRRGRSRRSAAPVGCGRWKLLERVWGETCGEGHEEGRGGACATEGYITPRKDRTGLEPPPPPPSP